LSSATGDTATGQQQSTLGNLLLACDINICTNNHNRQNVPL
jgi:hypothetical protein